MKCKYCEAENLLNSKFCCRCGRVLLDPESGLLPDQSHERDIDSIIFDFYASDRGRNSNRPAVAYLPSETHESEMQAERKTDPTESPLYPKSSDTPKPKALVINGIITFFQLPCMLLLLIAVFAYLYSGVHLVPAAGIGFEEIAVSVDRNIDRGLMAVVLFLVFLCVRAMYGLSERESTGPQCYLLFFLAAAIILPSVYLVSFLLYTGITLSALFTPPVRRYYMICICYLIFAFFYYRQNRTQFASPEPSWKE